MAKRKRTKGQTTIYKTKDRVTRTSLKTVGNYILKGGWMPDGYNLLVLYDSMIF
jgi:hypothetical protein